MWKRNGTDWEKIAPTDKYFKIIVSVSSKNEHEAKRHSKQTLRDYWSHSGCCCHGSEEEKKAFLHTHFGSKAKQTNAFLNNQIHPLSRFFTIAVFLFSPFFRIFFAAILDCCHVYDVKQAYVLVLCVCVCCLLVCMHKSTAYAQAHKL